MGNAHPAAGATHHTPTAPDSYSALYLRNWKNGAAAVLEDGELVFTAWRTPAPKGEIKGYAVDPQTHCLRHQAKMAKLGSTCLHGDCCNQQTDLGLLPLALPNFQCTPNVKHFRVNGPQDTRILPLGGRSALLFTTDNVRSDSSGGVRRTIRKQPVLRHVTFGTDGASWELGAAVPVSSPSASVYALGKIEKNWAPFTVDAENVYAHAWLDLQGTSVALKLNATDGRVMARYESQHGGLHVPMRAPATAAICGGTPAIRLNASHFLAIGHTRYPPPGRGYGMFAYTLKATPPFGLQGITSEFQINISQYYEYYRTPLGLAVQRFSSAQFNQRITTVRSEACWKSSSLVWGVPPNHSIKTPLQFVTGLAALGRGMLLVSWGSGDRHSVVTRMHQSVLLNKMRPL